MAVDRGPPANVPADELWARIVQSDLPENRPFEDVPFPRNDPKTGEPLGRLAIWPLKDDEITIAKAEATRYARACIKEKIENAGGNGLQSAMDPAIPIPGYMQVYDDACATEMVWRFCRRIDNRAIPAFPTAAECRRHLSSDEKSVLCNAYALVQVRFGPIVTYLSEEEMEAWIRRLAEGGSAVPLHLLSWEQRTELLMHSVRQLLALRTASSSAGSPPSEPTPSESAP